MNGAEDAEDRARSAQDGVPTGDRGNEENAHKGLGYGRAGDGHGRVGAERPTDVPTEDRGHEE